MPYIYEPFVAVDPNNTANVAANASGQLFATTDTGHTTPLTITDLNGLPASGNQLTTNGLGIGPAFQLAVPEAIWWGGGAAVPLYSFKGVLDQTTTAATAAESSASAAQASAIAAQAAQDAAAAAATAPTDASVDAGIIRYGAAKGANLPLNVKDYGAKGDGVADDTAAIQAALDAVPVGGRAVYLPAGRYKVTSALRVVQDGTTIYGDGAGYKVGGTSPAYGSRIEAAVGITTAVLLVQRTANDRPLAAVSIRDLAIDGGLAGTNVDGILFRVDEGHIDRVNVWNCSGNGVHLLGYTSPSWETYDTFVTGCIIGSNSANGALLDSKTSDTHWSSNVLLNNGDNFTVTGGASVQVTGCHFYTPVRRNIFFNGSGARSKFANCKIEGAVQEMVLIDTTNGGYSDIQFTGCGFASLSGSTTTNTWDYVRVTGPSGNGAARTQFVGNSFSLKGGGTIKARYAINLETSAAQNTVIVGNSFGPASHWGTGVLNQGSNSSLTQFIKGNFGLGDAITPVTQATAYTPTVADCDGVIEMTSATAVTVTIPTVATAGWVKGNTLTFTQAAAGQVTFAGASGVTLRSPRALTTRAQWATVTLRMRATNEWVLAGDLT